MRNPDRLLNQVNNPDYYERNFDNQIEKKESKTIIILKNGKWEYKLQSAGSLYLNEKIINQLKENDLRNIEINGEIYHPKIVMLKFFNNKLYQGRKIGLVYVKTNNKIYIVGNISFGEIYKIIPIEIEVGKNKIIKEIEKLLGCKNNYTLHSTTDGGYEILEIHHHIKRHHVKIFGFIHGEIIQNKGSSKQIKDYIYPGTNGILILNSKQEVIGIVENYGPFQIILNKNGQIIKKISNSSIVKFTLPTGESITIKVK